ncbi:hypothetical protein [Haloactinopolyspora sp.]|uniref:hypothetical protein n=1 Tax=Haloactinopolyspora sp. TaxID=1966353 RepID=UPI0026378738|nr:hypothetical protein [Haloactinopolyspora sp.]
MSAPDPAVIERLADALRAEILKVNFDYGGLYSVAYARPRVADEVKTAHQVGGDLSSEVVGDSAALRRCMHDAAESMFRAFREIQHAQARLNDLMARIDKRRPVEPEQHERAIAHPADRGDVRRAEAAQQRRAQRLADRQPPWARDEVAG